VCWSQPCVLDSWEKHLEKNLPPNLLLGQITRGIGGLLLSLGLSFTFSSLLLGYSTVWIQSSSARLWTCMGIFFFFLVLLPFLRKFMETPLVIPIRHLVESLVL
jgi:hypothetical protein